jgi:transcriptional regulator with XRE-family HTH domain
MSRSPAPHLRKFGQELRRLREQAGYSQGKLASEVPLSQGMISAIEGGRKATSEEYIGRFDVVLNTSGQLWRLWKTLNASSGLAEWARDVVRLQEEAAEIRQFQLALVPGLLQTEEYAWATLRAGQQAYSDEAIREQVQTRIKRQKILTSGKRLLYMVVLDESVLRRPIGGSVTMVKQLDQLLAASQRSNIIIQVVPLLTEDHPCLSESFQLIGVPEKDEVLYLEWRLSGTPIDALDEVQHYVRLFGELRGAALPPAASYELMERIRGDFQ